MPVKAVPKRQASAKTVGVLPKIRATSLGRAHASEHGAPPWWTALPEGETCIRDQKPRLNKPGFRKSDTWEHVCALALGHLKTVDPKKGCMVFDIDGTVLFNNSAGKTPDVLPNPKGIQIAREAARRRVPIYFLTARVDTEANRENTMRNLESVGFVYYTPKMEIPDGLVPYISLIMRPPEIDNTFTNVSVFKKASRDYIRKETGLSIYQSWGDQPTDHIATTSEVVVMGLIRSYNEGYAFWGPVAEGGYCGKLPGE